MQCTIIEATKEIGKLKYACTQEDQVLMIIRINIGQKSSFTRKKIKFIHEVFIRKKIHHVL